MRFHRVIRACAVLFPLCLCACAPYKGTRVSEPPLETHENLVYLDSALGTTIQCETLEAEELSSGRVHVYARFFNKQNRTAECQVQIKFKDDRGRVVDDTGWLPFVLPRRESTEFKHTSLSHDVKDFTFLLRKAK